MKKEVNDIHAVVRSRVFENLWPGFGVCFSIYQMEDAGPEGLGDLLRQNVDFLMVEVVIDDVRKSGPGVHSPDKVFGGLELTYYTKDRLDDMSARRRLEQAGGWFAKQTLSGIRFREYLPGLDGRLSGFQNYSATVAFEFETRPQEINYG